MIDQPLMQNVLTDLAIESEASTLLAMRMSAAYDAYYNGNPSIVNCSSLEEAQELFRIGVTISKYYVTKRLPHLTYECMEVSKVIAILTRANRSPSNILFVSIVYWWE